MTTSVFHFGLLMALLASHVASAAIDLKIIPGKGLAGGEVTLLIGVSDAEADVEIAVRAARVDSNDDGVIDRIFEEPVSVGRVDVVRDVGSRLDHAKDRNPMAGKIEYRLRSPDAPGEYLVEVKPLAAEARGKAAASLVLYSRSTTDRSGSARALWALPEVVPQRILVQLLESVREGPGPTPKQKTLWMADFSGERTQLTFDGVATDPQWAPVADQSSRLTYSFAKAPESAFDIWVMEVGSGQAPIRVTRSDEDDLWPTWAPDARRIAYLRGNSILLSDVGAEPGATERPVVNHEGLREILAWDERSGSIVYKASEGETERIWAVQVDPASGEASKPRPLAYTPLWELVRGLSAAKGRDRMLLEWSSRTTGEVDIYAIHTSSSEPVNLTEGFRHVRCTKPTLSADASRVAFVVTDLESEP